jgi:hypothetical protein
MSTTPRIVATAASAALLAAVGAGTAVLAIDTVTASEPEPAGEVVDPGTLQTPQDDRTTVYRTPDHDDDHDDDDDDEGWLRPAPPTTGFTGGHDRQGPANTSKAS